MWKETLFMIIVSLIMVFFIDMAISQSNGHEDGENTVTIPITYPNPENLNYKIEIDNGLNISYKEDYSVTFNLNFTLKNGQTYKWQDIPFSIDKKLWKRQIESNKFEWGVDFNNVSSQIKNDLDYLTLFITNSTGLSWNDINLTEDNIIIKNKVSINRDFFENFDVYINKTNRNIIISGFNRTWIECLNDDCLENITQNHWKDNGGNTYNISIT